MSPEDRPRPQLPIKDGTTRPGLELQPRKEVEKRTELASDVFADTLISRAVARLKQSDREAKLKRPFGARMGLYELNQGKVELFQPAPIEESRKKVKDAVARMGPHWEKSDGSPARPRQALAVLERHWHRLMIIRQNRDVPTDAVDAYAQLFAGTITPTNLGLYGHYAYDQAAEGIDRPTHDLHKGRLLAKTSEMMQSGEYKILNDGDWRYFNHSNELVASTRDRIYISARAYGDSSAVIGYWEAALKGAGIGHELMYKISVHPTRLDTIVACPGPDIDPNKLRLALELFHTSCPPELLNENGVATGNTIGPGISYGPEYFEHSSMNRLMFGEKLSFGIQATGLLELGMRLAYTRLYERKITSGNKAEDSRISQAELMNEVKRCFRELLICADINPETMVPFARGGQIPDWAKPLDSST